MKPSTLKVQARLGAVLRQVLKVRPSVTLPPGEAAGPGPNPFLLVSAVVPVLRLENAREAVGTRPGGAVFDVIVPRHVFSEDGDLIRRILGQQVGGHQAGDARPGNRLASQMGWIMMNIHESLP
jgi:hypothetical protein